MDASLTMSRHLKTIAFLLTCSLTPGVWAQDTSPRQDHAALRTSIERFLQKETAGLPGKVSVEVGAIDPRLNLPGCIEPEVFLPGGSRVWGKTTVGARCTAPSAWRIYVSATVRVRGNYIAAAAPLAQGRKIEVDDIVIRNGELTTLPAGLVTSFEQAVGRSLVHSVPAGAPLRQDVLRTDRVVQQGQMVRLVSTGSGFRVSAEGRALNNAQEGQVAQARTSNGQVISGIAKSGGIVEVAH